MSKTNYEKLEKSAPKDWQEVKLGEVVSVLGDGLHGTPNYSNDGGYYFINGNNIRNGKIIIKKDTKTTFIEEYKKYKKNLNERTILISINGTLGNVALYKNEKCFLGKSICYFNVLNTINTLFIKYIVINQDFQRYINNFANGTTIKNVSLKTMREYQFLLPPLPEQKAIAEVLSSLDDKIDLLQKQNQTLESTAQTLFRKYFIQDKKKDWEEIYLSNIYNFEKGIEPGSNHYHQTQQKNSIRFIRVGDMLQKKANNFINKQFASKPCNKNDLMISFDGTPGRVVFDIEGVYSSGIRKIKSDNIIYDFLGFKYLLFQTKKIQNLIQSHTTGTVILHAGSSINSLSFFLPKAEKINNFNKQIEPMFAKIQTNQTQIQTLEKLRNSLLPKLISGKIRVKF